jgi:D-aspartate ligase
MYQLCRELDVPCPEATVPESLDEAQSFAECVGYPVIAKLTTPWRMGGAKLRSTSILDDRQAVDGFHGACEDREVGYMLQEFIPGDRGHDWFVHGYCGVDGTCRPIFSGVKERSYPAHAGLTSLGRATANPSLVDEVSQLLGRLSYRGIFDLDLRFDSRDGKYKLLDFNPRLGAQFRLFHDSAGVDVVRAQYLDMTGVSIPHGEQDSGRCFLVENYDPLCALAYWRRGELDLTVWLASLRGVDETAWFARDDLRPFGLMCLRMGWRLATRPLVRHGARSGPAEGSSAPAAPAGAGPTFRRSPPTRRRTRPASRRRIRRARREETLRV